MQNPNFNKILYALEPHHLHLQARYDEMEKKGWTIDDDNELQLIEFEQDEIILDLQPVEDIDENWILYPRIYPLVN